MLAPEALGVLAAVLVLEPAAAGARAQAAERGQVSVVARDLESRAARVAQMAELVQDREVALGPAAARERVLAQELAPVGA